MKPTLARQPLVATLDRLVVAWALAVVMALFAILHSYGFDDPYITYRYAANLADGHGFVYNPGERVLSTTAPLYALILALAKLVGLSIPLVSNFLSALSMGLGALALYYLGRLGQTVIAGVVAAVLYPLTLQLLSTFGGEMVLVIAVVLWAFVAVVADYPILAGVLLAGATLLRADAALAAALVGGLLLMRREPQMLARLCLAYGLTMAPFLLAAWAYFGSLLPMTLGTKRSQAQIVGSESFYAGLLTLLQGLAVAPAFWPLLGLTPGGLWDAVRHRAPLTLALSWGLLHTVAYIVLGVTAYFWYYGPSMLALIVAAALGAELLARVLTRRAGRRVALVVVSGLTVIVLAAQLSALHWRATTPDLRLALYRDVGEWLSAHTHPEASVATLEVGIIGFYSQRPMIDFAGLIQPEVAAVFSPEAGYATAAYWAIAHYRPAYIINQEASMPLLSNDPDLATICSEVAAFADPRFTTPLTIYRCMWE
jgi:hypothetical protein